MPEFRRWLMLPETSCDAYPVKRLPDGACRFLRKEKLLYVDAQGVVVACCAHPKAGEFGNLKYATYYELWQQAKKKR
ncbi:Uncharacterised protein [BD1-7 clade bacterium]|uniref:4Fe4S-binding SPASM domain-containing protein n=1 Tax=BD1-7 clade bacterium TaxID=2029982 RepID=A0A5S9PJX7_9GAMM|nr:Uncharacterised protein [BD1-7 clade bacterium]